MSDVPSSLTRNQLAEFLPNQRAVRAFEQLLRQVNTSIPTDLTALYQLAQEISLQAESGSSTAQSALDLITRLSHLVDLAVTQPPLYKSNAADYIDFATAAPTYAAVIGRLHWGLNGTLNLDMTTAVNQLIGQSFFIYGKASAAVTKGQLIRHTGAVGASGVITFAPTAAGMTTSDEIIGIAAESIALNGFGYVMTDGILRGIDTSGTPVGEVWADGDELWYHPTIAGAMTKTKPSAPNQKTHVAEVINAAGGGSGSVQVHIVPGTVLGGQDSNVQLTAPADKDLLQYDNALSYWKNVAISTIAEPPITAGTTVQYWRGDKTWQDLATAVRATVLTGLSTATNAVITAADTVLSGMGKLQAQISAILAGKLSQFASTTSAELAGVISDETGSGALVFGTSPTLTTPKATTTIGVGNTTASASGAGISFPATQSASTDVNTLDDYEEGNCSLTITSTVGSLTTASSSANYTKIGRSVLITGTITITNNGTGSGAIQVAGLPFSSTQEACGIGRERVTGGHACTLILPNGSTTATVFKYDNSYPVASTSVIAFSLAYTTST